MTLPCPPNTEKKRETRGQKEEMEHRHGFSVRSAPQQDQPAPDRLRYAAASLWLFFFISVTFY